MSAGRNRATWTFVGLWMAGLAAASLASGISAPSGTDIWLHAMGYAVLAWLVWRALPSLGSARRAGLAVILAWGYGLVLEGLQAALPYRTAEVRDLMANAAGAILAGAIALSWDLRARWSSATRRITAVVVIAGLSAALSTAPGIPAGLAQPAPAPTPSGAPTPPGAPPSPGVATPAGTVTQAGVAALPPGGFAGAKASGVRAVKLLADWSVIEERRGQPVWADLDRAVAAAVQEGLAPILVIAYPPKWATIGTGADLLRPEVYTRQPPRDPREWERFVGLVAARYKDRVREWQIWTQLGLPAFRGTGSEYLILLQTGRARIRALDPAARVAVASPLGMDLNFLARLIAGAPDAFDVISLSPHGFAPEGVLRPLAVLNSRRGLGKSIWMEWAPEAGIPADRAAALWARMHAVAQAAGVERLFATELGRVDVALRQMVAAVGARPYAGYLARDPDVFAVAFGAGADAVLVAWAGGEGRTLELPPAPGLRVAALDGQSATSELREGRVIVRLGEIPVLIAGVPPGLIDEARATAASRGPLLPVPSPDKDYSRSAEVFARLGRIGEERGLYNLPFRTRRNGAVEPIEIDGGEAVRTNIARQVVYVYFDLDDTFLYFSEGKTPVEVTVEVWGARARQSLGFNLLYDSTGGYRFTPWQWVEARDGWVTYTIRLTDASFANTWGWDFAVNAAGNRAEDLIVRTVSVRKVTP